MADVVSADAPTYLPVKEVVSADVFDFLDLISDVPDETPVMWKSSRDATGRPGIWLSRGAYKLKHGSFVDPSDLSCYGAPYYEPAEDGRHDCLQIGHGLEGPEGCRVVESVGEFHEAVRAYLDEEGAEGLKLLQPDGAFELHGKLTKGWSAVRYEAPEPDGEEGLEGSAGEEAQGQRDPGVLVFD